MWVEKRRIRHYRLFDVDFYSFYSSYHRETKTFYSVKKAVEEATKDYQKSLELEETKELLDRI